MKESFRNKVLNFTTAYLYLLLKVMPWTPPIFLLLAHRLSLTSTHESYLVQLYFATQRHIILMAGKQRRHSQACQYKPRKASREAHSRCCARIVLGNRFVNRRFPSGHSIDLGHIHRNYRDHIGSRIHPTSHTRCLYMVTLVPVHRMGSQILRAEEPGEELPLNQVLMEG